MDYEENKVMFKDNPDIWHEHPVTKKGLMMLPLENEACDRHNIGVTTKNGSASVATNCLFAMAPPHQILPQIQRDKSVKKSNFRQKKICNKEVKDKKRDFSPLF